MWDDVRARLREYIKRVPEEASEPGLLGAVINGQAMVHVPGRPGWMYVRLRKGSIVQAYNPRTAAVFGLDVRVREEYGVLTVVGVNIEAITTPGSAGIAASAATGPHTHRLGSGNEDLVEGQRMEPGLVRGAGGLMAYVEPFAYWYQGELKRWPGGQIDLAPLRPAAANTQAWALIGLNLATETLVGTTGTAYSLAMTLLPQFVFDTPFTHLLLGAVRLRHGQTEAPSWDDYLDPRAWLDDGAWRNVANNGSPLTPRRTINFTGGVTITDVPAQNRIDVAIAGGSSSIVVSASGNIDNLAIGNADTIIMTNTSAATLRGIAGGTAGRTITILSAGTAVVGLVHQSSTSAPSNRLVNLVTSNNTFLAAGSGRAVYTYNDVSQRWVLVTHIQGSGLSYNVQWQSLNNPQPSIGNGTLVGSYELNNTICFFLIRLDAGSTTTFGTGFWDFNTPYNLSASLTDTRSILGQYIRPNPLVIRNLLNTWLSTNQFRMVVDGGGIISPTMPFSWATGDVLSIAGWFRAG